MQLSGSITALATPFGLGGEIDFSRVGPLVERQIEGGTRGLVVAGSTGEAAMLAAHEFEALLRAVVMATAERVPVLAGCGLSGTDRTIDQVKCAKACGIDIALVVAPPYVRPTQEGLYAHFSQVAQAGGLPIVLYNVPSRAAVDVLPATVERLAALDGVIGIKEALPDLDRIRALLHLARPGFAVLSGDDPTALAALQAGADGVISVASNVAPRAFARLCALARSDDQAAAQRLDVDLHGLYAFLGSAPNPIPLKAILSQLSLCADEVRLPLLPLPPELRGGLPELAAAVSALEHSLST